MARPQKDGVDYFPLDVKMDDEIKLVEARFGIAGFGVLIKLYQIIYDNGYFINWTEREQLLYSSRINADINLVIEVVNECTKWGLFDSGKRAKYGILTSRGIQKRYIEATQRRKDVNFIQEYLLVDVAGKYINKVNVRINRVNVDINPINECSGTQSKVKESKGEESKEESTNVDSCRQGPTPYQKIVDLYHETCRSYPHLKSITKSRKEKLHTRWGEYPDISEWREAFMRMEASDYCRGNKGWKATFDWLIDNDKNMAKVLEGNYDNKGGYEPPPKPLDMSRLKGGYHGAPRGIEATEELDSLEG